MIHSFTATDAFAKAMKVMNHTEVSGEMLSLPDTPQVLLARFASVVLSKVSEYTV